MIRIELNIEEEREVLHLSSWSNLNTKLSTNGINTFGLKTRNGCCIWGFLKDKMTKSRRSSILMAWNVILSYRCHFSIDAMAETTTGFGYLANHWLKDRRTAKWKVINSDAMNCYFTLPLLSWFRYRVANMFNGTTQNV